MRIDRTGDTVSAPQRHMNRHQFPRMLVDTSRVVLGMRLVPKVVGFGFGVEHVYEYQVIIAPPLPR